MARECLLRPASQSSRPISSLTSGFSVYWTETEKRLGIKKIEDGLWFMSIWKVALCVILISDCLVEDSSP